MNERFEIGDWVNRRPAAQDLLMLQSASMHYYRRCVGTTTLFCQVVDIGKTQKLTRFYIISAVITARAKTHN